MVEIRGAGHYLLPDFYSGATGNPAASVRDYCSGAYNPEAVATLKKPIDLAELDLVLQEITCSQ